MQHRHTTRHFVHELFHEHGRQETPAHHWTRIFIASVICLSILSVILETEPDLYRDYHDYFLAFEIFTVVVFSLEYILRLWCIVEEPGFERPIVGRLKYIVTPLALVDLLAVVPFYLPALITVDLRFIRILRLIRLVRVMKLGHYSTSLSRISKIIHRKRSELAASMFILAILLLVASTIMYYIEHDAQPEQFRSIPAAFWWGIETLTTVGYGDVAPITPLGKVCAAIIAVLGIGLFGLPAGILASGFLEEVQHKHDRLICEECKRSITEAFIAHAHEEVSRSEV
jgi:voltage-gated potassium channel